MMDIRVLVERRQNAVEDIFLELPDHVSVGGIGEGLMVGLSLARTKMRSSVIHSHGVLTLTSFGSIVLRDPMNRCVRTRLSGNR